MEQAFHVCLSSLHVISWTCTLLGQDQCIQTQCECWRGDWEERSSVFCNRSYALGILQIIFLFLFHHRALLAHFLVFCYWQKVWRLRKPKFHLSQISSVRTVSILSCQEGWTACIRRCWIGSGCCCSSELRDPVLQELECQTRGPKLCCISHGLVRNLSFDVCASAGWCGH